MQLILETPRLLVKEYTLENADDFIELQMDPAVMQYIRAVATREEAMQFLYQNIRLYRQTPNMGRWAVYEKASNDYAGSFAIIPIPDDADKIQIGYALVTKAWGKGYATELVEYGKPYFFKHHAKDVLYAVTELPNIASQKVLLKSGFKEELDFKEGEKNLRRFTFLRENLL